jgi:hypothetical protein
MDPKGFMGYPKNGNACELSIFGHEHYPSDSLNQNNWAHAISNYHKQSIIFLVGLGNTPLGCNRYVMEPKRFFI